MIDFHQIRNKHHILSTMPLQIDVKNFLNKLKINHLFGITNLKKLFYIKNYSNSIDTGWVKNSP